MSKSLLMSGRTSGFRAALCLALTCIGHAPFCQAQNATPSIPSGVQDVVKLVKAGLNEDVVMAQIKHAGAYYNLSADQIIYLHEQGVSQNEITALLGTSAGATPTSPVSVTHSPIAPPPPAGGPVPPVPVSAPSAPTVDPTNPGAPGGPLPSAEPAPNLDSFRAQLAPFGTWADVPGYGPCWRPNVEAADPFWRPYCDQGHWAYTADGWSWQSEYPWGDIAFHYGRWYRDRVGWVWVPAYDWAPAWVCWRHADAYCGWAPLPPAAVFRPGIGLWFGGRAAVEVDFGLGADAFTFLSYDHFWDRDFHAFLLPRERIRLVFGRSAIMNGYRLDHGRFIVEGLGRERIAALTHHEIRVEHEAFHESGGRGRPGSDRGPSHDERKDRRDR